MSDKTHTFEVPSSVSLRDFADGTTSNKAAATEELKSLLVKAPGYNVTPTNDASLFRATAHVSSDTTEHVAQLTKSLEGVEGISDAVREQIQANLEKDITTSSPVPTGLQGYDLRAPSLKVFPYRVVLRQLIARTSGFGAGARFKRITAIPGSGTGIARINPTVQEVATPGTLNRGQSMAVTGDDNFAPYKAFAISSNVTWDAEVRSRNYEDVIATDRLLLVETGQLAEEGLLFYSRGTDSGLSGVVPAPGAFTATVRNAVAGEQELANGSYSISLTASAGLGESAATAVTAGPIVISAAGKVIDLTPTTPGAFDAAGATGYAVFASVIATPTTAQLIFQGRTGGFDGANSNNLYTLQGVDGSGDLNTSTLSPSLATVGASATAGNYDGVLSQITAHGGYSKRLNGKLTSIDPIEALLDGLWVATQGDPEQLIASGTDRATVSKLLEAGTSAYRTTVDQSNGKVGAVVKALQNRSTGREVDITVAPMLDQGNIVAFTSALPVPQSGVPAAWEVKGPQDLMQIDWSVIDLNRASSVYWMNGLVGHAPIYSGQLSGVVAG
jgi:hypothetical protein